MAEQDCGCSSELPDGLKEMIEEGHRLITQHAVEDLVDAARSGDTSRVSVVLQQIDVDDAKLALLARLYDESRPMPTPGQEQLARDAALRADRDNMRKQLEETSGRLQKLEAAFGPLTDAHAKLQHENAALRRVLKQLAALV